MPELFASQILVRALTAALTASIISAIVGTFLVLRRLSSMGAAIAHMCFAGAMAAYVAGVNPVIGALIPSLLLALAASYARSRREGQSEAILAAAIGLSSAVAALALSFSREYSAVAFSYLVGDVLGASEEEVSLLITVSALIMAVIVLLYRGLKYSALDPETAEAMGLRVMLFEYLLGALAALLLVVEIRVVGMILAQVYLVAPAAAAWEIAHSVEGMIALSIALSLISAVAGFSASILLNLPTSAVIGVVAAAIYTVTLALSPKRRGRCLLAFLRRECKV